MSLRLIFALLGLAVAQPALAQQQEPPARVGSVSYVSGTIAFHTAGETQWSAAGVNYPVATGGSFWTDPQARAELQIGPSTVDMAGGTEIDVTDLNEQVAQIGIPQGALYLHLRQLEAGQSFEIDLPQGAVWLLQPGAYDIDAGAANQPARVAVFAGSARFVGGSADTGVNPGDTAVLSGSNPVTVQVARAAPDAFVAWARSRDYQQSQVAAATHYVSPQMTGYADLDQYGGWQTSPQYGEVWYPSQEPANWAPYRDGRWVWVQPWGWTWVDQQPWGFAPFHYGRWAYMDNRWGWVPGQYVPQPVYAPALVAFVGAAAGGFIAGGGGPSVGWFPLAPNEPYWPSYTHNQNYIRNVNRANVRDINTIVTRSNGAPPAQATNGNFANRRFATVVPQQVFANAQPVAPHALHVAPAALAKAPVVLHPPAVRPAARPAAVAVRGPTTTRPVPKGPGVPPPGRPGTAAASLPGAAAHPPGTPAGHGPGPGHPPAPANTAAIPPRPGAANANEHGPHAPAAIGEAKTPAPGTPERGTAHPAGVPNTAALPAPGRPGAAAVRREVPPRPAASPERRPAALNEAHPAASPRPVAAPHPQAQVIRPPAPVARPVPAARPAPVGRPAPVVVRPPAPVAHPAVARPAPVAHPPAARPAAAVPHPPAAHAPPARGGKPEEKHE